MSTQLHLNQNRHAQECDAPIADCPPCRCHERKDGQDVIFAEMAEEIEWLKSVAPTNTHTCMNLVMEMNGHSYDERVQIVKERHLAEIKRIKKIGEMK